MERKTLGAGTTLLVTVVVILSAVFIMKTIFVGDDLPTPPANITTTTTSTSAPPTTDPRGDEPIAGLVAAESYVTRVIDGDTLELKSRERVRLIGIDAPEEGHCGYQLATDTLRTLVEGRVVVLVAGADEDADRYGRLLRYVNVDVTRGSDGTDVGLALLQANMAIARYDSRDGYGAHVREDEYVAADAVTPEAYTCLGSER